MTDKKKIDEAVSLNVSTTQGEMNSNTTFTADDTAALVMLLKNAGVQSQMFNGPATLSVDIQDAGGSMTSTIQAPDLRSIMQLLEPDFKEVGDAEAAADEIVDPVTMEIPAEEPMDAMDDMLPMDDVVDVVDEPEVVMDTGVDADDLGTDSFDLDGDLEEEADYDYRDHDVHPRAFAGKASKEVVQPATNPVPARSGDNPIKSFKDYVKETNDKKPLRSATPAPKVTAESLINEFGDAAPDMATLKAHRNLRIAAQKAKETSANEGVVQHVDDLGNGNYSVSDWMSDETVVSYSNGHCIGGNDPLESF